jgi:hypothetical protein
MRDEFSHPPRHLDRVESLGKLHPYPIHLDVDQGRLARGGVVVERIFHEENQFAKGGTTSSIAPGRERPGARMLLAFYEFGRMGSGAGAGGGGGGLV